MEWSRLRYSMIGRRATAVGSMFEALKHYGRLIVTLFQQMRCDDDCAATAKGGGLW
jgi:hypothetical protein